MQNVNDFSRSRKLDFAATIQFILSMESGSLNDGSDLNIARNPNDTGTYSQARSMDKGYNQIHLNALYDLCKKRYTDVMIQPAHKGNESMAMTQMIDCCPGQEKTIFIADKGYKAYNIFAHVQEKGMYYLIRVKDGDHSINLVLIRIMQEIYACLILYNYCEIITMNVVIHQKRHKAYIPDELHNSDSHISVFPAE